MTIFDLGGEKVHDTVVMNEKGCFSLGWGRVCWRDGPSSNDFLALCTHHEKIIETNGGRRKWYCECTTYFQREVHATKHEHRPRGGGNGAVAHLNIFACGLSTLPTYVHNISKRSLDGMPMHRLSASIKLRLLATNVGVSILIH